MMTFKEFYKRAVEMLPAGDSVNVTIEAWNHCGGTRETLEWKVFSAYKGKHFCGPTPEQALALLEVALAPAVAHGDHLDSVVV